MALQISIHIVKELVVEVSLSDSLSSESSDADELEDDELGVGELAFFSLFCFLFIFRNFLNSSSSDGSQCPKKWIIRVRSEF